MNRPAFAAIALSLLMAGCTKQIVVGHWPCFGKNEQVATLCAPYSAHTLAGGRCNEFELLCVKSVWWWDSAPTPGSK